jgi:site-specific recombinase XerD
MLRDLFPRVYGQYEHSPFGAEIESFARWLSAQGHLRWPLRLHLRRAKEVLEHSNRFRPGEMFDEAQLQIAFVVRKADAYLYLCTGRIFARFLRSINRLAVVEAQDPLILLARRYQQYLVNVRGLSTQARKHHGATVTDLFARGLPATGGLAALSSEDIEAYIQLKSKENSRASLQHVVAHLRAFLRYGAEQGVVAVGLDVIDMPRVYRDELPPRALDWTTVRRLLASVRRRSPRDWRDYAVLHLLAYYGLRPSEVAALRVDSIDWNAGTLRVEQRKTLSTLVLPLAPRTIRILRCYLQSGRPDSNLSQLFLRIRSPIQALKHYGIIDIFNFRMAQSGLDLGGASSYALRHAFAMRLLRRGVGLKAIGDLLGHRSLEATCVYLRVDTDMLRTVALPVPTRTTSSGGRHV